MVFSDLQVRDADGRHLRILRGVGVVGGGIVPVPKLDGHEFQKHTTGDHVFGGAEIFLEVGRIAVDLIGVFICVHFKEDHLGRIVRIGSGINGDNTWLHTQCCLHFFFDGCREGGELILLDLQVRHTDGCRLPGTDLFCGKAEGKDCQGCEADEGAQLHDISSWRNGLLRFVL